jgi:RimJ/RimL family protein N-acetyltransferase
MKSHIDPTTDLPIGPEVDPSPAKLPQRSPMAGRYISLAPLDAMAHGESLWENLRGTENEKLWLYLFDGPIRDQAVFDADLQRKAISEDPQYFAILDQASRRAGGYAAYLRMEPKHRCIEVGAILLSPVLQRTRGATEAMYLMAKHVFEDLGYRRYEWKCNALNLPSRRAALRLGFTFEGIFRQHMIIKGRNRDTAWYSMLDSEWPARKAAFERWLEPTNFDAQGRQKESLSILNSQGVSRSGSS